MKALEKVREALRGQLHVQADWPDDALRAAEEEIIVSRERLRQRDDEIRSLKEEVARLST